MKTKSLLITDEQSLTGAKSRFGHSIPVYDDGYGQLFIHRDSMGISGIVRAQTWEDAYSICEDEFFPSADDEAGEEMARIDAMPDGDEKNHAQSCWDESYGFRGNGMKEANNTVSHIYAKDLNGDSLDVLTPELLASLEITLEIETPIEAQVDACLPDWEKLVASLIPTIGDDYRASEDPDDNTPGMCLTIGFTPEREGNNYSWGYQTGDNSYSGGAYCHPHWAVVSIYRDSIPAEVAQEISYELAQVLP